MTLEPAEARFLDERQGYSLGDIVSMSGLSPADLRELVDCGALVPENPAAAQWSFSAWAIEVASRARRLREEFDLDDVHTVAIVVKFEQRLRALEREVATLKVHAGER